MTSPNPIGEGAREIAGLSAKQVSLFWAKVIVAANDVCWLWTGSKNRQGYGTFSAHIGGKTKAFRAHRLAYTLARCAPALSLDHLCRNRACCNPAHLEEVTTRENNRRGGGWAGINAKKECCPAGHPLVGTNLIVSRVAGRADTRACRTCRLVAQKKWRDSRRSKLRADAQGAVR